MIGKLGYLATPLVSIGPEIMVLSHDRFNQVRSGRVVAFNVTSSAQIILSGGYAWDMRRDSLNDQSGGVWHDLAARAFEAPGGIDA